MVFFVIVQVVSKVGDFGSEDRDLNLGRSRITFVGLVLRNDVLLFACREHIRVDFVRFAEVRGSILVQASA